MPDNRSAMAAIVSAAVAVVAIPISIVSLVYANRSDARLEVQDNRQQVQEERLDRQDKQQYASKVYVGEVPQYFYTDFRSHGVAPVVWAVINASGTQLDDVWVEEKDGSAVLFGVVQRCTFYTLYDDFDPVAVHFTDPYGKWRRGVGIALESDAAPVPDVKYGSEYTADLKNCSG